MKDREFEIVDIRRITEPHNEVLGYADVQIFDLVIIKNFSISTDDGKLYCGLPGTLYNNRKKQRRQFRAFVHFLDDDLRLRIYEEILREWRQA
jgi:DNA-binding cell septation regulator SpoVG